MVSTTTVQINRGPEAELPTLLEGELAFSTDTFRLFVGAADGNKQIGGTSSGDVDGGVWS